MHVAVGDLDGDVDDDIAVAETGGLVRIFYNEGGNLLNTRNLTTDSGTRKVVIADLEGTGTNDIIAINEFRSNLTIWRRSGSTWNGPEKLLTGQKPTGLAVGDVMGDSNKDIVISNYNENNVTVYEWEGAAWKAPYTLGVGFSPNDVFIADANGDGTKDIITADLGVSTVTIIPNEGTGWGTKITKNVGNDPYAVWVEDLNKDTKKDIVTTNSQDGTLTILYWIDNTPPQAFGIPDTYSINEDTPSNDTFIDLWYYFHDDETPDNLLQFSLVNGSDNILIGQITNERYFTLNIGPEGENWHGNRTFTVKCVDAKLDFVEDEFMVMVEPVNDKPDLISLAGKDILSEDLLLTNVGFYAVQDQWYNETLVSSDADNDTLSFKTNITEGSLTPHERFDIDAETGAITFLPNNDDAMAGYLYFNLTALDGNGGESWVQVTLGISNVNDPPEIFPIGEPDGTLTAKEKYPYNYQVKGQDIDGDTISWSDDSSLFQITEEGNISFTPNPEDIGTHHFNITADDGNDGVVVKPVTLTITNVNNPPDIPRISTPKNGDTFYVDEIINFSAEECFDPDIPFGDEVTYEWKFGDGLSDIKRNTTHQYTSEGPYTVELTVSDSEGLYRNYNITINIQGAGQFPSKTLTDKEYDDAENDVNMFQKGKGGNTIGAEDNIDIDGMTTKRVGMDLEIVIKLQGVYSPDITYEVYVSQPFIEERYEYGGTGELPTPNTPSEVIILMKGSYCESKNISEGSPETLGSKNVKFTLPLSKLIGEDDFKFFGIAYYRDNDTFKIDSVGDGKLDPTPYKPPPENGGDEKKRPWYFIPLMIILAIVLFILIAAFIFSIVRGRMKKKEEEEEIPAGAPIAPAAPAAPMQPAEATPMPPPPTLEDEGDLIPPDVPPPAQLMEDEEPPPELLEPEPVPVEGEETYVPIGASAQEGLEKMLLPPPEKGGEGPTPSALDVEDRPELPPSSEERKDDIFDELFTPIGGGGEGGEAEGMEVECYNCHGGITVTSAERPLVLHCPHCGTESMLP
jgi:PKD repeat protein